MNPPRRQPRAVSPDDADHESVEEARKRERLERENQLQDLAMLLQAPAGRRVVWRILSQCGIYSDGWDPSARIHFNAGKRNVGLWLLDEVMAANDEAYLLMQREAKQKEKQDA